MKSRTIARLHTARKNARTLPPGNHCAAPLILRSPGLQVYMHMYVHVYVYMLCPDSQPLTRFEAGQCIQFQSWSDLNWLAVLTKSVYKLELHAATVIGTTRVDARYSENWRVTTRRREAMLSLECTFKARARLLH